MASADVTDPYKSCFEEAESCLHKEEGGGLGGRASKCMECAPSCRYAEIGQGTGRQRQRSKKEMAEQATGGGTKNYRVAYFFVCSGYRLWHGGQFHAF